MKRFKFEYHYWLLLTAILVLLLITFGGILRATNSGVGCPDWIACITNWNLTLGEGNLLGYVHRILALITGIILVVLSVVTNPTGRVFCELYLSSYETGFQRANRCPMSSLVHTKRGPK